MIRIEIWEEGRWKELPRGPFQMSMGTLSAARDLYYSAGAIDGRGGRSLAQQILREKKPDWKEEDLVLVSFAVAADRIRVEVVQ